MQHVMLVSLADNIKYGGFVTYTAQLMWALSAVGIKPFLVKPGWVCKEENYFSDIKSYRLKENQIINNSKEYKTIISYVYWNQHSSLCASLLRNKAAIVFHDPTEIKKPLIECIKKYNTQVITIRKTMQDYLLSKFNVKSIFIYHPYKIVNDKFKIADKNRTAVSISRVDFDKHIEILCKANELLQANRKIDIYGFINRIYDYHKLSKKFPEWKNNYKGICNFQKIENLQVYLISKYKFCVDMSSIKNDGGGTQYTFLEAIDANCVLILNEAWVRNIKHNLFKSGENCFVVKNAEELRTIINKYRHKDLSGMIANSKKILSKCSSVKVGNIYKEMIKKW